MKYWVSVLGVLWVLVANPSLLPAQNGVAPDPQQRLPYAPVGLSLARPYVRGKTPVVFVHGLWASPAYWRPMIESLEADPSLNSRFQFWTFGYATGNPIPYSAYLLRNDLDEVRRRLDPGKKDTTFDRMVLVGHSMGGLLAKAVAVDSGDRLWRVLSDRAVSELAGEKADAQLVRDCMMFRAYPSVRRVIYIATPHAGSPLDRGGVRALGKRLVVLPDALRAAHFRLIAANPRDYFRESFRNGLPSSIDELESGSPILTGLAELPNPAELTVHTIIPILPDSPPGHPTDGLVSYSSAHVAGAASEKLVSGGHLCQDSPAVIAEVRRILLEHESNR